MPDNFHIEPLLALVLLMASSMAIGVIANRSTAKGGFLAGYFLGNRGLGSWSMALTATVMSGGTFMGFPSLTYRYGWTLALWIASYMIVPLCTFGVLGKRIGQISRQTGAITLPDLLRERFGSPALGYAASLVMIFILTFSLISQFRAGALILEKVLPGVPGLTNAAWSIGDKSPAFIYGLLIFTLVVVAYTAYGGFLAAVWTDLFQSILMAVGVLILFPLVLWKAGAVSGGGMADGLAAGTRAGIEQIGPTFAYAPGGGADGREFLPLGLLFSLFCIWSIAGMGQPASLVRLMAFRDTRTLRQAMFLLAVYNTLIYVPLLLTFISARAFMPPLKTPDDAMPMLTLTVASPWVAGLILAAPFGAVMATVSGFLVQISSGLVQDVYHRWVNPRASEGTLKRLSYASIAVIALAAALGTLPKLQFLQIIIIFAGGAAACAFLVPAVMAAYWSRATAAGAMAAMLGGFFTVVGLYLAGILTGAKPRIGAENAFYPIYLLNMEPFVWGLLVSVAFGIAFSLLGPPVRADLVRQFFSTERAEAGAE